MIDDDWGLFYFESNGLAEIISTIKTADICVPGYYPSQKGMYDSLSIAYEAWLEGKKFVLLPDRNVTNRLHRIQKGDYNSEDNQFKIAAALLSFCQQLDIQIEPSIAIHELAHKVGNKEAWVELAGLRSADNGNPKDWLELGVGDTNKVKGSYKDYYEEVGDLAFPLHRWNRNYIQVLKIAEIDLYETSLKPQDKINKLIEWMYSDFMLSGPAAIFSAIFFAPKKPPKSGMIKKLRSSNREQALNGIKNAAWDLTYLSEFTKLINQDSIGEYRYIFASFDKTLRAIARSLIPPTLEIDPREHTKSILSQWWPKQEAAEIVETIFELQEIINDRHWLSKRPSRKDYITFFIEKGESSIKNFSP